jgi:hypothetical protein
MAKRSARDQTVQPNPVQPPAPLLSPPGQRDTVASEQAASEGAHAGQDLPPTAVEVLAYQLGIRLEQAREEDGHSDPDSMYQTDRDFIPTDIGLAVYSFRALDQAFSDFADVVPSNPTITGSGTRLINDCVQAWNKWSSLPFEGFKLEDAEPLNTHFVYFNLQQLVDVIDRMFDYLPTMVAVPWFVLGRSIGECPTCPKCSGRYDTLEEDWPIHGSGNGNEFPEEEQIPKCSGHDDDLLEVVQMLIEHLGLSAPDLFPLISESRETRKLLPYHPDVHWRWFRIEAGLNELKRRVDLSATQSMLSAPSTKPDAVASDHDMDTPVQHVMAPAGQSEEDTCPEYLGVHVDEKRCLFVCGGQEIPLRRKEPRKLLQFLIKSRESVSTYDAIINDLNSTKAAVQATKSQLDKELRTVRRKIENLPGVGYRLIKLPE